MALVRIMRRKDAHHVFYGWSAILARRTDVLEEAWLDTETNKTSLEKTVPKKPRRRKPKPDPAQTSLDDQLEKALDG